MLNKSDFGLKYGQVGSGRSWGQDLGSRFQDSQKRKISKNAIFEGPKKVGSRGRMRSILDGFCRPKKAEQNAHSFRPLARRESAFLEPSKTRFLAF